MSARVDTASRVVMVAVVAFVGLGVGASIWFGVYANQHDWFHKNSRNESQEVRAQEWVGEKTLPKAPIKITIHSSGCVKIERARVDNDQFTVIFRRVCGNQFSYSKFMWREKANETVIRSEWTNHDFNEMGVGESFEWNVPDYLGFFVDPRATEIVLETRD